MEIDNNTENNRTVLLDEKPIGDEHAAELQVAKILLENPSLTARMSTLIGSPLEKALKLLPESVRDNIISITTKSLEKALHTAISTLPRNSSGSPANFFHTLSVAVTGAAGGAFGLGALALELPVSTTLMLRSIADIAQAEGEIIRERDTQLACIEVFALGGPRASDDATEAGYFGVRSALAKAVSDAAQHLAMHGMTSSGAPALTRFIGSVATRFSIPVTEKVAAQTIPIIGAAGGAFINTLFIQHFQDIARGHFIVRRLERIYGRETIRTLYCQLPSKTIEVLP